MITPSPTIRSLARTLGLSRTTVSDALRGAGRIESSTIERVRQAARSAGYRRNPLAAAVMSQLRRSRSGTFRGVLAIVDIYEPERPPHGIFHRELVAGIKARASSLGFKAEEFVVGHDGLTTHRLDSILESRGINGLLLLPSWNPPDWSELRWDRYAGVYADYNRGVPAVHCVCCEHYRSMLSTLHRLASLGYRRPGLFLERGRDERIHHRMGSAFRAFQEKRRDIVPIPTAAVTRFCREEFVAWFQTHQPDVVLCHFTEAIDWMESCGVRVPAEAGFVCLNLLYQTRPSAGLDLQPRELGARNVELLIAQLQRQEFGLPLHPTTTTLMARWRDGPTLRTQPNAPKSRVRSQARIEKNKSSASFRGGWEKITASAEEPPLRPVQTSESFQSAPSPSLRTIANALGLSRTTVSDALRGSPQVNATTASRVQTFALKVGYQRNPLAAALMSELRLSRGSSFRGVLAAVDINDASRPFHSQRFHHELTQGAKTRAKELGFKVEEFAVGRGGLSVHELDSILQTRGIHGVILLPTWDDPDLSRLDWSRYAGVYTDHIIERPALHSVCSDHYRSMMSALEKITALGYRRPGWFGLRHHDERLQYRWEAAFRSFQENQPLIKAVPPLIMDALDREIFMRWFELTQPDVVLGHHTQVIPWMEECGARLPATHGFVGLNVLMKTQRCTGLDLQPRILGARSAEVVIAQLQRNERGIPEWPVTTTIPARWIEGPPLRKFEMPAAKESRNDAEAEVHALSENERITANLESRRGSRVAVDAVGGA